MVLNFSKPDVLSSSTSKTSNPSFRSILRIPIPSIGLWNFTLAADQLPKARTASFLNLAFRALANFFFGLLSIYYTAKSHFTIF